MQGIDRRVEIPVLLLQPRKFGLQRSSSSVMVYVS
jgi:hypothetical protein